MTMTPERKWKHKKDCPWATPLPTGNGFWGCTCGLDELLLQLEDYAGAAPLAASGGQHFAEMHEREKVEAESTRSASGSGTPAQDTRFQDFDDYGHPANIWWRKHGEYMLSGGGRREYIWACRGWIAREQMLAGVPVTGDALLEKAQSGSGTPAAPKIGKPASEYAPEEAERLLSEYEHLPESLRLAAARIKAQEATRRTSPLDIVGSSKSVG